ncbi:MAG: YcjF family protein [Burkholderiaceae bacterium]
MSAEHALLVICLYAAFADGRKDDREREQIRRFSESLGTQLPELPRLYQDVLLKRVSLAQAAAALGELGQRQLAYEMAVCTCDVDGSQSEAERRFLAELKQLLQLAGDEYSERVERQADELARVEPLPPAVRTGPAPAERGPSATLPSATPPNLAPPSPNAAELDKTILNASILNGALELLPQSWASMAIIPLQIRLVYRVGRAHGYELDQGHIKEFLATVGVGLTSQYLEQFGRKLLGGLLGKMAGRGAGGLGRVATGAAFSFATTYALGQIANRYYAGGRQMNSQTLQRTFEELLGPAKQLQQQYLPQIEQRATGLDAAQVMALVKGA